MVIACYSCEKEFPTNNSLKSHCDGHAHTPARICPSCKRRFKDATALNAHRDAIHNYPCNHCDFNFATKRKLKEHTEEYHNYACGPCAKEFASEGALNSHNTACHDFTCRACKQIFTSATALESHNNAKHYYKCRYCDSWFPSKLERDQHIQSSAHDIKCSVCTYSSTTRYLLEDHISAKHSHKCSHCNKICSTVAELLDHVAKEHRLVCGSCPAVFDSAKPRQRHIVEFHHLCKKCSKSFSSDAILKAHDEDVHAVRKILGSWVQTPQSHNQDVPEIKHSCDRCPAQFNTAEIVQEHRRETHMLLCPNCLETQASEAALLAHYKAKHTFTCNQCGGAIFDSIAALQKHDKDSHTYLCSDYPSRFLVASSLTTHIKSVHTLYCDSCPNTYFTTLEAKEQHMATTHRSLPSRPALATNPKSKIFPNIECPSCPGTFFFQSVASLQEHQASVHSFTCPQCAGLSFNTLNSLEKHRADTHKMWCDLCKTTITDVAFMGLHYITAHLLKCEYCSGRFDDQDALTEHVTRTHPLTVPDIPMPARTDGSSSTNRLIDYDSSEFDSSNDVSQDFVDVHYWPQSAESREISTQTQLFPCMQCSAAFETKPELETHNRHSPFHGRRVMGCTECNIVFPNQIKLLQHIESKAHRTRWVLSMI